MPMVNFTSFDVVLVTGFVTVTGAAPAEVMAEAGMTAVNRVALTKEVAHAVPPKFTVDAASKKLPLTVSVKAAPPATPLFGETAVTVGKPAGAAAEGSVTSGVAFRPPQAADAASATVVR